jgi:hypothetical protein
LQLCGKFLLHSQKHNEPGTHAWYKEYLDDLCGFVHEEAGLLGALPAAALKPFHVTAWLDAHPGWTTKRGCAIRAVKRAFNWADDQGVLSPSPIKKLRREPHHQGVREVRGAEVGAAEAGLAQVAPAQVFRFDLGLETGHLEGADTERAPVREWHTRIRNGSAPGRENRCAKRSSTFTRTKQPRAGVAPAVLSSSRDGTCEESLANRSRIRG